MDHDDVLRVGYRQCARLTKEFGTTYYWGAAILPPARRRHVYAVYALCRLADDIVDDPAATIQSRDTGLRRFAAQFRSALSDGGSDDPVLAAVVKTVLTCDVNPECFDRFFGAMEMDLTTSSYETWEDLCFYMEGSAAVIGEMMLPVLEPATPAAKDPARALGLAFQLTNFLRDVDEDLDRGRIYLPQADIRRYGVDIHSRSVTPEWCQLMSFEIARNRDLYAQADPGIAMLPPSSARCVATARILYARILDRIESARYDVFSARAHVPTYSKALTAARVLVAGPPRSPRTRPAMASQKVTNQ